MSKLEMIATELPDAMEYKLVIPRNLLVSVELDPFDRAVIDSPVEGLADHLQSLEILVRRIEEQS